MRKNKKKTIPEKIYNDDSDFSHGYSRFGGKKEDLPKEAMDWAGIKDSVGKFPWGVTQDTNFYNLADLNDLGRKFKTIADIIQKYWEVL